MRTLLGWCRRCMAVRTHVISETEIGCTSCSEVRTGVVGLLSAAESAMREAGPVVDVERCRWCRTTLPLVHDCKGDPTPCPDRREDGSTCGVCSVCIPWQEADLKRGGA